MKKCINKWCGNCSICGRKKSDSVKHKAPLCQNIVGDKNERMAIDIIGPLPTTENGNNYIMVVGDYFTKYCEAYPIPNQLAQTIADKLLTEWIVRFGCPN